MATPGISTNDTNGVGYQTGFFSGPLGTPVDQSFFDAAFAGRINTNKIYKEAYNCNIVGECTMSTWLEEFMGYETDCHPAYTLLEQYGQRQQIRNNGGVVVPVRSGGTANIRLSGKDHFVSGAYVLPQQGNTILLAPNGEPAEVVTVTHATGNDTVLAVRLRSSTAAAQSVPDGSEMLVLSGSEIADCACPTGQFAFDDLPVEIDVNMITFGDKGEMCGDALNKCQFLKIPFRDENGNVLEERWYVKPQQDMYKRFEKRKHYETLLNPNFGLVPLLRARGIKFTPASSSEITTDDIRAWKQALDLAGVVGREYAVFAGRVLYSQFQRMLLAAGVVKLDYSEQPMNDCKWINMEYCGIKVEGITLHIYDECSFSNGKELGGVGSIFPNSAIFVPMWNNPNGANRTSMITGRNGYTEKMFTRVYFKDISLGRVWDTLTDANGVISGANGGRNTFGTGCEEQEWTVKTRFLNEIHCANAWGYMGLGG